MYFINIDRDVYLAVVYISPEYSSNIDRDVYLAVVYISPEYSSGNTNDIESVYSILLNEVE